MEKWRDKLAREYTDITGEEVESEMLNALRVTEDRVLDLARLGLPIEGMVELLKYKKPDEVRVILNRVERFKPYLLECEDLGAFGHSLIKDGNDCVFHEEYTNVIWKYLEPRKALNFLKDGVSAEFLKEYRGVPFMESYLSNCTQRGLEYMEGPWYEIFTEVKLREDLRKVEAKFWDLVFNMRDCGAEWDEIGRYTSLTEDTANVYLLYLEDKYSKSLSQLSLPQLILCEALMIKGVERAEDIAEKYTKVRMNSSDALKLLKKLIRTVSNLDTPEAYFSLIGNEDEAFEILESMEIKGNMPKDLVGGCLLTTAWIFGKV